MTVAAKKKAMVKLQLWEALEVHYKKISKLHLREIFAEDPNQRERLVVEAVGS